MRRSCRHSLPAGASRGIGREVALGLARSGCHVVVAARTVEDTPELPGTIFSVAAEVEALGVRVIELRLETRDLGASGR